jgi:hypothetical protein
MKDIKSLNVVEVLTREERMERKAIEARRLLQERRDKQKAAKADPYGHHKPKIGKNGEGLPEPPPLEDIISSAPPPEKGKFLYLIYAVLFSSYFYVQFFNFIVLVFLLFLLQILFWI